MEKLKNKNSNGITLIALIITIIVMLILVGVTITVALNGGLFKTAQSAATNTMVEAEREQLLSAVVAAYDTKTGAISKSKLEANLGTSWNVEGDEAPYTVTSPKGNKFTVNADGTVGYIGKRKNGDSAGTDVPEDLKKYILGADGKGRNLIGNDGILDSSNFSFKDDPLTEDINETETLGVEFMFAGRNKNGTKGFVYARFNNKAYKIIADATTYKSEKLELIYEPKGKEGQKTVEGWTTLYDNGVTAEAVSPEAMGDLRLGYAEGTTDSDTQLSQAIELYNSAITTINNYCKNLEGLPTNIGVRSVGAPAETTTEYYSSDNLKNLNSAYNGVGLEGDTNFEQDLVRMCYWKVNNVGKYYWVASRCVYSNSGNIRFDVNRVGTDGNLDFDRFLWCIYSSGDVYGGYESNSVRPIITINI